jgi:hypothetical protein
VCERIEIIDTSKLQFGSEGSKNFVVSLRDESSGETHKIMLPSNEMNFK